MPLGQTRVLNAGTAQERTVYECSHCGYLHSNEEDARNCHVYFCEECGEEHSYQEDADNCCRVETFECQYCGEEHETYEAAIDCCHFGCPYCGNRYRTQEEADECHVEERAGQRREERRMRLRGRYPQELLQRETGYLISIPEIPGRPVRICSVEQELTDGGLRVARLLYDMGICTTPDISNYTDQGSAGWITVKQDGSLDRTYGGEVVYSRFDLSGHTGINNLSRAMTVIREMRNAGLVRTDMRTGLHIHISAVDRRGRNIFGPAQMAALYEIGSWAEDVIYRLGAAGWSSHRGDRYAQILPKFGAEVTAGKVARNVLEGGRHYSLNFTRLLDAARNCRCGACQVGDWAECSCGTLGAGTVEWRYFNGTTKPETLHGWLILAHAMTAKAFDFTLGSLPEPNGFRNTPEERHPWIFAWILNECPMSDSEREVLISLAKRAPLAIDWEEFDRLVLPDFVETDDQWDEDDVPQADLDEIFAGIN